MFWGLLFYFGAERTFTAPLFQYLFQVPRILSQTWTDRQLIRWSAQGYQVHYKWHIAWYQDLWRTGPFHTSSSCLRQAWIYQQCEKGCYPPVTSHTGGYKAGSDSHSSASPSSQPITTISSAQCCADLKCLFLMQNMWRPVRSGQLSWHCQWAERTLCSHTCTRRQGLLSFCIWACHMKPENWGGISGFFSLMNSWRRYKMQ